jgi:DNA-binding transcriptional MerR regulator/quercetin dioxygenase-like cupin family protein
MTPDKDTARTPHRVYIKEAARMVGVSPNVLRAWERRGLVAPQRSGSGYRTFTLHDVARLREVRHLVQHENLNGAAVRRVLGEPPERPRAEESGAPDSSAVGDRVRARREGLGLSVRALAARSGLSPSYVSGLERGKIRASVAGLHKLAAALGTTLIEMLGPGSSPRQYSPVVPSDARRPVDVGIPGVRIEHLAAQPSRLEPLFYTLQPGASSQSSYSHEGEEFLFVVEGTFEVTLDEQEVHALGPGDALTFASSRQHRWQNRGAGPTRLIWVNTPPTF